MKSRFLIEIEFDGDFDEEDCDDFLGEGIDSPMSPTCSFTITKQEEESSDV